MKAMQCSIIVNRPIESVFAFTISPQNTPKWVALIATEETSEWPIKLGTVYRSERTDGTYSELEVASLEDNKVLMLSQKDGGFYVKYSFEPISDERTRLLYELPDTGMFSRTFIEELLRHFKQVIEAE